MHTGSVFPRFIQMGALGVCKLSHLLIFVFQAQIDLEILNFIITFRLRSTTCTVDISGNGRIVSIIEDPALFLNDIQIFL